eukprot:COSAG02_NODE_1351_length_13108_cov_7.661465_7_plen_184_part_00
MNVRSCCRNHPRTPAQIRFFCMSCTLVYCGGTSMILQMKTRTMMQHWLPLGISLVTPLCAPLLARCRESTLCAWVQRSLLSPAPASVVEVAPVAEASSWSGFRLGLFSSWFSSWFSCAIVRINYKLSNGMIVTRRSPVYSRDHGGRRMRGGELAPRARDRRRARAGELSRGLSRCHPVRACFV